LIIHTSEIIVKFSSNLNSRKYPVELFCHVIEIVDKCLGNLNEYLHYLPSSAYNQLHFYLSLSYEITKRILESHIDCVLGTKFMQFVHPELRIFYYFNLTYPTKKSYFSFATSLSLATREECSNKSRAPHWNSD
jgi:hypothetical protein